MRVLTDRETQVLWAKFNGATHVQAAHALGMSVQTFKNHLTNIYAKLGVSNLWGAIRAMGWIGTTVAEEAVRIAALRSAARTELLALADAVGSAARPELLALADAVAGPPT